MITIQQIFKSKPIKGASPRKLDEQELHQELYRANTIINMAYERLRPSDIEWLKNVQSHKGITPFNDPKGELARLKALNRINHKKDYLKIIAINLLLSIIFMHIFLQG